MNNGITIISDSREIAPVVQRLRDEGVPVDFYIHGKPYKNSFNGIVPKVSMEKLRQALKKNDTVFFDMVKTNEHTIDDYKLLKYFGLKTNLPSVFGPIADKLKKDHRVICGAEWADSIELDRWKGSKLARKIGLIVPESYNFTSLKQGIKFLESQPEEKFFVFKLHDNVDLSLTYVQKFPGELVKKLSGELPKRLNGDACEFMLQEVVKNGCEISTEAWFDGDDFVCWSHTLEDKRFMSGFGKAVNPKGKHLGINTGSASNTVWLKEDTVNGYLCKEIRKLKPYLQAEGYIGCIDLNTIVTEDGKAHFLEFTARCGYSALYLLFTFIPPGGIGNFLLNEFRFIPQHEYVASQVVSIPPYPYLEPNLLRKQAKDVAIDNKLDEPVMKDFWLQDVYQTEDREIHCCGADGQIGVMVAGGSTMEEAIKQVYQNIEKLRIGADVQYRVDHLESHTKRMSKLDKWGINIW